MSSIYLIVVIKQETVFASRLYSLSIFGLKIWREAIALEMKIRDGIFSVSI